MGSNANYSDIQKILSGIWPEWKITGITGRDADGIIYEILRNDVGTDFVCSLKVIQIRRFPRPGSSFGSNSGTMTYGWPGGYSGVMPGGSFGGSSGAMPGGSPFQDSSGSSALIMQNEEAEAYIRTLARGIDTMMKLKGVPNIVSIEDYAVVQQQGTRTILIRSEKLESLAEHIRRMRGMSQREITLLGADLCAALSHIEQLGIVHGNISAGNIFHSGITGYKLGMNDFHGSRSSADNFTSDTCSLGLLLEKLLGEYIPAEQRDLALTDIVRRAFDPDPRRRYRSAGEFQNALLQCLNSAFYQSPAPEKKPSANRRPASIIKILLSAAVILFALLTCLFFRSRLQRDPDEKADEDSPTAATSVTSHAAAEYTSVFEDPALEYAVRTSAALPKGRITSQAMQSVRSLDLSGGTENEYGKIRSLSGLSEFTMLEEVDLSDNDITDISELEDLQHLKILRLRNNKIVSITALRKLSGLQELDLSINTIRDITPLADLTNLEVLDISSNNITEIYSLQGLVNLRRLSLNINHASDISPLEDLKNLNDLGLSYNEIDDYSPLTGLKNLSILSLKGNNIRDIGDIRKLSFLKYLDISDNPIDDPSPLKKLPASVTVISD